VRKKNHLLQVIEKKSNPHNMIKPTKKKIDVLKKVVSELRSVSPYKTKYNF